MTPQINRCLTDVRKKLSEDWEGPAYGPSSMGVGTDKGSKAASGEGGANNPGGYTADNAWDKYISDICDHLMATWDIEEGQAMSLIQQVADEMAEDGLIPEYPAGGKADDEQDLAIWLGKAKSAGFHGAVYQKARDMEADE
jgi:hypothetical protein